MVDITSTKGTPAKMHLKSPGFWFATASINSPPAERPLIASRSLAVRPLEISDLAQSAKSLKVFCFCRYLPSSSYHQYPISPPPRM